MPRSASGSLTTLLNSGKQFYVADLLTITQASGAVTRLTAADTAIILAGDTYTAGLPFVRDRTKLVAGLEIDRLGITLYPDPAVHTLAGVPWPAAVAAGQLDEARIAVDRVFMPTWGDTSAGAINLFSGRVGTAKPSRAGIVLEVLADLELLRAPMPRNTYQPGCVHTLFDAGCGLAKATYAVAGTVGAGSTATQLNTTLAQATGYFDLGRILFTSGALAGQYYAVKSFVTASYFKPTRAFLSAPATGDTFTAYPGCDKAQSTCSGKFANLARFRGYPYIPTPENAR